MSFAELKERVKELTAEEREELSAHLVMLAHANDPEWRQEMARRATAMQAGNFATKEELLAMHERLSVEDR